MNTTSRESVSKTDERIDKLADQLSTLVEIVSTKVVTPAPVKAVEETCVTCGGAHSCATTGTYNQVAPPNRVSNQMAPPGFAPVQNNGQNRFAPTIRNLLMNKENLLELAKIPLNGIGLGEILKKLSRKCMESRQVSYSMQFSGNGFDPRVPLILGRSFLRTCRALIDVYREEITLQVDNEAITFNSRIKSSFSTSSFSLLSFSSISSFRTRYSSKMIKSVNRIDIIDAVCEEYAPELLGFSNNDSSGSNPTPTSEPLTSEFILEEIETYLTDDSISPEIDHLEEGIMLGHKILKSGIKVDRAKVDFIAKLPHPTTIKGVRTPLKRTPILVVPDWNLPFKLMCDASDFAIGAVLGQRKMKHFQPIHYASKTIHYTTTEKEMLAVVRQAEVGGIAPVEFFSLSRNLISPSVIKKGSENLAADHLSRLENPHKDVLENKDINENVPLETLGVISSGSTPWFADYANYHAGNFTIKGMTT
ncbi:reverse transcriptase domain-containing protein [Tanacetum coccineum]|uniref:Reverse transcriptase domain-containing protein n=1 Tax=Tanacetum coccineum TaxID=301880 RepID=A0ABQ5FBW2_9ASTR